MQLSENARRVLEARYLWRDAQGKVNEGPDLLEALTELQRKTR